MINSTPRDIEETNANVSSQKTFIDNNNSNNSNESEQFKENVLKIREQYENRLRSVSNQFISTLNSLQSDNVISLLKQDHTSSQHIQSRIYEIIDGNIKSEQEKYINTLLQELAHRDLGIRDLGREVSLLQIQIFQKEEEYELEKNGLQEKYEQERSARERLEKENKRLSDALQELVKKLSIEMLGKGDILSEVHKAMSYLKQTIECELSPNTKTRRKRSSLSTPSQSFSNEILYDTDQKIKDLQGELKRLKTPSPFPGSELTAILNELKIDPRGDTESVKRLLSWESQLDYYKHQNLRLESELENLVDKNAKLKDELETTRTKYLALGNRIESLLRMEETELQSTLSTMSTKLQQLKTRLLDETQSHKITKSSLSKIQADLENSVTKVAELNELKKKIDGFRIVMDEMIARNQNTTHMSPDDEHIVQNLELFFKELVKVHMDCLSRSLFEEKVSQVEAKYKSLSNNLKADLERERSVVTKLKATITQLEDEKMNIEKYLEENKKVIPLMIQENQEKERLLNLEIINTKEMLNSSMAKFSLEERLRLEEELNSLELKDGANLFIQRISAESSTRLNHTQQTLAFQTQQIVRQAKLDLVHKISQIVNLMVITPHNVNLNTSLSRSNNASEFNFGSLDVIRAIEIIKNILNTTRDQQKSGMETEISECINQVFVSVSEIINTANIRAFEKSLFLENKLKAVVFECNGKVNSLSSSIQSLKKQLSHLKSQSLSSRMDFVSSFTKIKGAVSQYSEKTGLIWQQNRKYEAEKQALSAGYEKMFQEKERELKDSLKKKEETSKNQLTESIQNYQNQIEKLTLELEESKKTIRTLQTERREENASNNSQRNKVESQWAFIIKEIQSLLGENYLITQGLVPSEMENVQNCIRTFRKDLQQDIITHKLQISTVTTNIADLLESINIMLNVSMDKSPAKFRNNAESNDIHTSLLSSLYDRDLFLMALERFRDNIRLVVGKLKEEIQQTKLDFEEEHKSFIRFKQESGQQHASLQAQLQNSRQELNNEREAQLDKIKKMREDFEEEISMIKKQQYFDTSTKDKELENIKMDLEKLIRFKIMQEADQKLETLKRQYLTDLNNKEDEFQNKLSVTERSIKQTLSQEYDEKLGAMKRQYQTEFSNQTEESFSKIEAEKNAKQKMVQEYEEKLLTLKRQYQTEISSLNEEWTIKLDNEKSNKQKVIQEYEDRLMNLKRHYQGEVSVKEEDWITRKNESEKILRQKITVEFEEQISQLKRQYNSDISTKEDEWSLKKIDAEKSLKQKLTQEFEEKISTLKKQHQTEVNSKTDYFEAKIYEYEKSLKHKDEELDSLQRQLKNVSSQKEEEWKETEKQQRQKIIQDYETIIEQIKQQHQMDLNNKDSEWSSKRQQFHSELLDKENDWNAKKQHLQSELLAQETDWNTKKQQYESTIKQLKTQNQNNIEQLQSQHITAMEQLKQQHNTVIEQLKSQHHTNIEQLKSQHNVAIEQLKQLLQSETSTKESEWNIKKRELVFEFTEKENDWNTKKQQYITSIDQLKQQHNTTIEQLKIQHNTTIEQLKAQYQNNLERLKQDQENELESTGVSLEQQHQNVVEKLKSQHNTTTEQLKQQHITAIEQLKQQQNATTEQLKIQHNTNIEQLRQQHNTAIDQLKLQHQNNIEQLKLQHNSAIQQLQEQHLLELTSNNENAKQYQINLDQLKAQHQSSIEQLKSHHNTAIEQLKQQHNIVVEQLKQQYNTNTEQLKTQNQNILQQLKSQHNTAIEQLKAQHQNSIDQLKQQHHIEINNKDKEWSSKQKQLQLDFAEKENDWTAKNSLFQSNIEKLKQQSQSEFSSNMEYLKQQNQNNVEQLRQENSIAIEQLKQQYNSNTDQLKIQHQNNIEQLKQQHHLIIEQLKQQHQIEFSNKDKEWSTKQKQLQLDFAEKENDWNTKKQQFLSELNAKEIQWNLKRDEAERILREKIEFQQNQIREFELMHEKFERLQKLLSDKDQRLLDQEGKKAVFLDKVAQKDREIAQLHALLEQSFQEVTVDGILTASHLEGKTQQLVKSLTTSSSAPLLRPGSSSSVRTSNSVRHIAKPTRSISVSSSSALS